jgi:predicted ATPase/class 3 adenylate cyclase
LTSVAEQTPVTFLFTDIEGSTRLWEQEPDRMPLVMARHDTVSRNAVERNRGTIVKMTGDGVHAAFDHPLDALIATLEIQQQLSNGDAAGGLPLPLRCGLHAGIDERRDGDFYGRAVNRAARIMSAAHGGQMLLSKAVAEQISGNLPEGVSLRDLGTVRLRDLSSPEHIYQVVHTQLRADFPALRSLEGTPNNLTQQLNSFIGRERELTEIKEMLASNRLVTLLGMGGIGKSRLSMQLAADILDDFPDGVWFVELAALMDPTSVPQAVASVLGVKEEAGRPVIDALTKYVRDLQLLIILDNCEQVIHGCADLAKRLLQAGSKVKILTSSRDYLQVAGETTYHVPTLSVPKEVTSLSELVKHEGVRLFIDRAAASLRGFGLTEQNAAAVADICYCLDGIPLAIELAAARVRALSVQTIAARLSDRFRLLVTADQTVLPRQRTLRALIDWSYDLLTEQERTLFQRLSVFAGGWTLEAAEAVCADNDLPAGDVLDLLARLVEKSLVIMEPDGERYRMLDTVRHFSQEKAAEASDEVAVRSRHLDFYLAVAEQARPHLLGPDQGVWLARLDSERENLLAAHAWCDRAEAGTELGLRLAYSIKFYWLNRGLLSLGHRVTVAALKRPGTEKQGLARSRALSDAGQFCFYMGCYSEALEYLRESLLIARALGDKTRLVAVLPMLGMACLGQDKLVEARAHLAEAVDLANEQGNKRALAVATTTLAQLHRIEGRLDAAESLCKSGLGIARELGDQESIAVALLNLAMVSITKGSSERAREMLFSALKISEEIGSKRTGQNILEVCTGLAALHADWRRAARLLGAAEAQAVRSGLHREPGDDAFLAPMIVETRNALGRTAFAELQRQGCLLSYEQAIADVRAWLQIGPEVTLPLTQA